MLDLHTANISDCATPHLNSGGAGPDDDALDPQSDEGEEGPEGGVDVGVVRP